MGKRLLVMIAMILSLFLAVKTVEAKQVVTETGVEYRLAPGIEDCKKVDPKLKFVAFLQELFNIMKYAGPILCLVLSTMDFIKAAAAQDKDALKKAAQTGLKRLGLAILLFFIPVLLNFLFPLLGWNGTCGIK